MTDSILRKAWHRTHTTSVPYPPPVEEMLLDTYPNAAVAYSFRKLRTGATAAVNIRRTFDNAQQDFGWDGSGNFDAAGVATFLSTGPSSGRISIWYDQSGHGLNLTPYFGAFQEPFYRASGVGSLPSVVPTDGGAYIMTTAAFDLSTYVTTQATIFAVLNQDGADARNCLFQWRPSADTNIFDLFTTADDGIYYRHGNTDATGTVSVAQPGGWDDTDHIVECYRDSGDDQHIKVDGSSLVNATRTADVATGSSSLMVFAQVALSDAFSGMLSELIIWGTDLGDTNRTAVRTDMNAYYSVF